MADPSSLAGKVALITGGAQRIGAETTRTLHRAGMDVLVHYRKSASEAQRLVDQLNAERQSSASALACDLLSSREIERLVGHVREKTRRLDLLVNNASSFYPTPLSEATENQWNDLLGSNLKGPFFLSQGLIPLLRKTNGSIVNLVDIHADRPRQDYAVYSIAKAGNAMMVKALARELGPDIRVNGVAPGAILWPEEEISAAAQETIISRTPLKRSGTPEDIARTVLFLARDAGYITGQIISVDGGRSVQQ